MFDKLIESDTAGAEFKNRSRYFTVSTIIVGILFLTAVVYSLYAAEVGLGAVSFDVSELVSPLETTEPKTPEPRQLPPNSGDQSVNRPNSDMARVDEPTIAPEGTSAQRNSRPSRSWEGFKPDLPLSGDSGGAPGDGTRTSTSGTSSYEPKDLDRDEPETRTTEPPPTVKAKPPTQSLGVINGKATYLPVPSYPPPARAVGAFGEVKVQVAIDEGGRVISAKAVSGHPFLRGAAETSARNARFSPTYLSKVPVKVTGVIMYNFKKP